MMLSQQTVFISILVRVLVLSLRVPFLFSTAENRTPFPSKNTSVGVKYTNLRGEVASVISEHLIQDRDDSTISLRRELGDFDELNDLFDGMILALPDLYIADTKILGATVRIWVTNLNCGSLEINDIDIDYNLRSNTRFDFNVDVKGLNIDCTFNWRYKWSVTSGSGTGQVYTDNNSAQTSLGFNSQGYDQHPPSSTSVNSCTAFIFISDMDFQGGIIGQILNTFERSIRGAVSNAIQSTACEELGSLGTTLVGDMLDYVYDLVESYLVDIPPEYKDVLNAEKQLVVPEGAKLINYSNFSSTLGTDTIGNLFQTGLNLLDEALGGLVPDPDSDDGYDLGVNRLLRYTILDEEGALAINMTNGVIFQGHDMLTETTINLNSAHLYGLDSFENFDPLNAFGQYTLGNNFFWKHLRAELSLTLVMKPSTKSDSLIAVGTDAEVRETITVSLDINDVDIDFYYLLAIEENELGSLQLGSLLHTSGLLPCILPSLFANEVTGLSAIIRSMDAPVLEGFISPGIDSIVSKAADAVYIMYESTLLKAMPNFFELTVRNITNGAISTLIDYFDDNATCAVPEDEPQDQYRILHFGDLLLSGEEAQLLKGSGDEPYGTVVRDLVTMVQEEVRAVNPLTNNLYINEGIVRNFTSQISGVPGAIGFPSDLFSSDTELSLGELTAALQLKLSNATITNIDSFGLPLKILEPISGNLLNNVFMIGTGDKPLRAMSQLTFAISDEKDTQIRNVIELGLEMSNTTVEFEALVTILESRFLQFPIEDINNLNCWLSMIPAVPLDKKGVRIDGVDPTLALNSLKVVMESTRLKIDCIECSSPLFQDLADLVNTDQAVEDLTRLTNSAVEYITEMLGGTFLQFTLDKMLVDAAKRCPHRPEFVSVDSIRTEYVQFEDATTSTSSMGLLLTLGSVIGVVLLVTAISRIIVRIVIARRHASWVSTLSCDEVANYKNEQIKERLLQSLLDRETLSMFRSPVIPSYVRFGVPLVILANIGFFLSGHLSIGASVDVDAQVAGEAIRIEGIFVFSMAESVLDMWDAGSKELAILISLLSGAWPYIKQLTVFFLWFLPPRITTVRRRESLFLWLDALGKWSFVDIFVLIISVPSFRVAIASPNDLSFIPLDFYAINVLVIPRWGLYSNMIAQLMSQFSSHLIIHFHRQIVRDFETRGKDENEEETDDHPTKLCDHLFERGYAKKGRPIAVRKGVNVGIVLTSLTFVVLLLTGVSMPSFLLSQYGLVGLVVEASPEQSSNILHSVFTIFNLLMDQARFTGVVSDHIGLGALSAIFFITVILVPMAQLLLLLQRWFGNLDRKARIRNFLIVESLQAWQYIEVYIFSVIIACWQLGTVSEYLINDYCGSFEGLFNSLAYFGILRPMDSQCFKIQAKVQSGSWILIAASVTLLLLNRIITSAAKQQVRDVEINTKEPSNISIESGDDSNQLQDVKLKPLSPSFSDTFRWLLSSQQEGGGAQLAVLAE